MAAALLSVACLVEEVAASWSAPCHSCHVPQPGKLPARASWWVLVQVLGGFAAGDLVCTGLREWLRLGRVQAADYAVLIECAACSVCWWR